MSRRHEWQCSVRSRGGLFSPFLAARTGRPPLLSEEVQPLPNRQKEQCLDFAVPFAFLREEISPGIQMFRYGEYHVQGDHLLLEFERIEKLLRSLRNSLPCKAELPTPQVGTKWAPYA